MVPVRSHTYCRYRLGHLDADRHLLMHCRPRNENFFIKNFVNIKKDVNFALAKAQGLTP